MQKERQPYPGPYSVCEPKMMLKEAIRVPVGSDLPDYFFYFILFCVKRSRSVIFQHKADSRFNVHTASLSFFLFALVSGRLPDNQ